MKYRQEIDGLRAVAIIPVILFHAGMPFLTGGYLGVDVFFVISGFLITKIIVDEVNGNRFSLINFYERRARRILPALFAVILATALFLPLLVASPKVLEDFGESILSVTLFLSNVYFYMTSGYFGTTSELSPLLHTWSLSVEEQFYVFFPLLAILCLKFGRQCFVWVLSICFIASLALAELTSKDSPDWAFYLTPTRAWELLIGSFGALAIGSHQLNSIGKSFKSCLAILGLLLILVPYFTFTPETPHPSLITLLPVLGTLLVILFASSENRLGQMLSLKPLVHIGLISYSLYLWHQPILAIAKLSISPHLDKPFRVFLLVLIYVVSVASYRYIETPFRSKAAFNQSRVFKYSSISMIVMFVVGVFCLSNVGIQRYIFPDEMKRYDLLLAADESHESQVMYDKGCRFWSAKIDTLFEERFEACAHQHGEALIVLGGSHGMDLYNAIAMNAKHDFVVSVSKGGCRAHDARGYKNPSDCQYQDFEKFAEHHAANILSVIYTQTPDSLFKRNMNKSHVTTGDLSTQRLEQVVDYLGALKNRFDLDVLMVGMLPPMLKSPIQLNHRQSLDQQLEKNISDNTLALIGHTDNMFREKLRQHQIPYVSKLEGFSFNIPEDLMSNGSLTYSDSRHLSYAGEKLFGQRLVKHLNL